MKKKKQTTKKPRCKYFWRNMYFSKMLFAREGNGNPLQYSYLENPMNRGAWWAAVHGVTVRHDWSDLAAAATSELETVFLYQAYLVFGWFHNFFLNSFDHLQLFIQVKFISLRNISMSSGTVTTILVLQTNQCFSKSFPNVMAYQWSLTALLYLVILYFFA